MIKITEEKKKTIKKKWEELGYWAQFLLLIWIMDSLNIIALWIADPFAWQLLVSLLIKSFSMMFLSKLIEKARGIIDPENN